MTRRAEPPQDRKVLKLPDRPGPRPLVERGRMLFLTDVQALFGKDERGKWRKSLKWIRQSFAPEYRQRLGRTLFWWEADALKWLDEQGHRAAGLPSSFSSQSTRRPQLARRPSSSTWSRGGGFRASRRRPSSFRATSIGSGMTSHFSSGARWSLAGRAASSAARALMRDS